MTFKDKIPDKIVASEVIDFSKDDSIIILKASFDQHLDKQQVGLMSSKIH